MRRRSLAPSRTVPSAAVMRGFQAAKPSRSVRTDQIRSGDAAISISVDRVFTVTPDYTAAAGSVKERNHPRVTDPREGPSFRQDPVPATSFRRRILR